jgi:hypothetical protein
MADNPVSVNYVIAGTGGHRSDYDRVLTAELTAQNICLIRMEKARHALDPRLPFLYAMVDSNVLAFLANAVLRSFRGRTTVGIFFRPGECFLETSFKYRIKRKLFQVASRLPHVSILTVIPFAVFPRVQEVASGWIYDLQFWDLAHFESKENSALPEFHDLTGIARGRRILMALGSQHQDKGIDFLVDLWCSSPKLRDSFIFVVAGKVDGHSAQKAQLFVQQGGLLIDRQISNDELISLYGCADIIWSCYPPVRNQSSGIFGRATQFGVPVIVCENSFLDKIGEMLLHPTLALPYGDLANAAEAILAWQPRANDPTQRSSRVNEMRSYSTSVLISNLVGKE